MAAGIRFVYYIEPYRKSLAMKLHNDSISEKETETDVVRILPYDGVAPGKYLELFEMKKDSRKAEGVLIQRKQRDASPKCDVTLESLPALEGLVVNRLRKLNVLESPSPGVSNAP